MLPRPYSPPSAAADGRESRVRALADQLRPRVEQAVRRVAESLVDGPGARLFGELELALRGQAHGPAAAAHRAGLQGRKKGGATAAASPAPTAAGPPSSSTA